MKMKSNLIKVANLIHRLVEILARQLFLLAAYFAGPPESQPPINDLTLLHSATTLALKIRNRQLTSEAVVKAYIERIKEIQPILNCVTETRFKDALEEAKKCDEILQSADGPSAEILASEKPFFGVPFTTKDCIAVEGMKQTCGLYIRKDIRADKDGKAIELMKLSGAIMIATTNVSELSMWWESSNYIYGTSKNPYNTRHIVGGSSGGEACLQSAAGAPCGIGSDIGGSIRMPCFFNGIFGHKPSRGVVSNEGQYPRAESEDQNRLLGLGPMSRYAEDLAPILRVIADKNNDLLKLGTHVDISKLKIYYMEDNGGELLVSAVDQEIKEAMRRVILYFKKAHNIKAKKVNFREFKKTLPLWFACMSTSEGKDFSYELANRQGRINIWLECLKYAMFSSKHTLIALFTAIFERFGVKNGTEPHAKLKEECTHLRQEVETLLGDDGIFLYPTHPTAAPMHNEPLIKPFNFSYTAIVNVLGLPTTACPLGLNKEGLPIGIQVVGGLYQDHITLAVAEELQKGFGGWVPPAITA